MEILTSVVSKILEPLVAQIIAPVNSHIGYVFQFRKNVDALDGKVMLLEVQRDGLQCSIEEALRQVEEVDTHVLRWKDRADTAIGEARALIGKGAEEAQRGCSLRLTTRYRIAKKAAQETSGIVQLLEEKSGLGPTISHRPVLEQYVPPSVEDYEAQSRTRILEQVMDALLDPNVAKVGVHGMGGIGKTTLVEKVHSQAKQKLYFDRVVIVNVTATPEIKRIRQIIAEFVSGSKLEESDVTMASRLHHILKDKKVLLILDDLWSMLELDEVGIPFWNGVEGCKILMTSRNQDVLSDMGSQKNIGLVFLSEEESSSLFEKKVIKVEYPDIAKEILAKCAGFPLLIVTLGGHLRNKRRHAWKNALAQLTKFEGQGVLDKVYSVLESSYNDLDDYETKQIFLLFGISSQSDTTMLNLLRYGLGLGYFKNYKVCEASNRFRTMIDGLKSRSLLDVDEQGNVKMHDIVRETAIRIAHTNGYAFREKDGYILPEWPSRGDISGCKIVSIPHIRDIRQLPEDLGCPDVEFLLLFSDWQSIKIPDSTFEGTPKLRVVHFSRMQLASFPVGRLHSLTNLHTLCLEDCHLLDLTTIRHLESLVILSFRGSELEALPSEIEELTRIKVLDLTGCSQLSFIRAGVLSKLIALEELLMRNSFENWEVEDGTSESNARLSELKCLPQLESLEICVPDTRALPKDLFSKGLERFNILIGRGWEFDHDSETTNTLKLKPNTNTDLLQTVSVLLRESEILYLDERMGSKNHLFDLEKERFPKLKKLVVVDSCELEQVVDCRKWGPTVYFPLLESLELKSLQNLVTICQGRPAPESFSQMKRLKITDCNKLKNLFSLSAVQSLPQLEEIYVLSCREMEALFVAESISVAEFPRLRRLHLSNLPRLKCFLYATDKPIGSVRTETATAELIPFFNEKVALPNLETLDISGADSIEMIWCSQLASSSAFDKLNSLVICNCDKLKKVGSPGRFQNLKSLTIDMCTVVEEIYQFEDGAHVENNPMIFELNYLYLSDLPRLKRIWKEDSTEQYYSFHNLESTSISDCGSLENIFPPAVAKTLSQIKSLDVSRCVKLEEIVAEAEEEEYTCSLFPRLTSLTIEECPKVSFYGLSRGGGGQPQQPSFSLEKVAPNLKKMSIDDRIFESMSCSWNCLIGLESLQLSIIRPTLIEVSRLQSTPHLRKLIFSGWCGKELWRCQTRGIDAGEPSTSIRFLKFSGVKRLRHVWRPDSQMDPVLPYLEFLELFFCYDLISLAPSPSASFRSLTTLKLWFCHKVTDLVNPATARTMANLVNLSIWNCGALKEIVAAEDDRTTRECIVFNKLKTLELYDLGSLQGFCISGSYSFEFPCLDKVSLKGCPTMRIFCNGEVITPKLHNVESIRLWGRDLNTTIKLHHENELRRVRYLRLSSYPELVERWGREPPVKGFDSIHELMVDQLALVPVAVPSNVLPALSGLNTLVVEKCDSVEEIFDVDGMDQLNEDHVSFMSQLTRLGLVELPKLRHVWNEDLPRILGLKNLSALFVRNCSKLTHIFTLSVALGLVHLRKLYVIECPLVEVIIKQQRDDGQLPADWDRRTIFPMLHSVQLVDLPSMMEFFSGDDVLRCPNLKSVRVQGCPRMCLLGSTDSSTEQDKNIVVRIHADRPCDGDVHEPILRILNKQVEISRLEEVTCQWNSSMDNAWHEIVPQSFLGSLEFVKLMGFPADHELLPSDYAQRMPNLERLTIFNSFCKQILPQGPRSISEIQPAVSFNKLTRLELFNLPELNHLVEEDSQSGSLFQHLKILKVSTCKRLTRLVTSITATGLANLEELAVEECEIMAEVVSSNRDDVGDVIVFEQLQSLELCGLPHLASFSSGNCTFDFPHLKKVVVRECPNMKTFAKNDQSTLKLHYVQIAGDDEDDDDDDPWWLVDDGLNGTIEKLFAEMNPGSIC